MSDPSTSAALRKVASGAQADWYGDWVPTSQLTAAVSARVGQIADDYAIGLGQRAAW